MPYDFTLMNQTFVNCEFDLSGSEIFRFRFWDCSGLEESCSETTLTYRFQDETWCKKLGFSKPSFYLLNQINLNYLLANILSLSLPKSLSGLSGFEPSTKLSKMTDKNRMVNKILTFLTPMTKAHLQEDKLSSRGHCDH